MSMSSVFTRGKSPLPGRSSRRLRRDELICVEKQDGQQGAWVPPTDLNPAVAFSNLERTTLVPNEHAVRRPGSRRRLSARERPVSAVRDGAPAIDVKEKR
jgi:hypothetical protein